jgi:LacI family transcriptional regulator
MKDSGEITIYDIAKALNISPSTVSRALKDNPNIRKETKKKIFAAARDMGYQRNKFASDLRQKRTSTLGVIVPSLNSYFMTSVISGIEKVTNHYGYNLIISQSQETVKKEIDSVNTLFNSRVDGLLVSLAYDTKSLDHFNVLFKKNIPVIFFDRVSACNNCISVIIDNYQAGYDMTNHLISQGCRRIVHLGGIQTRNVYRDRFNGYKQALLDNDLPFDESLVIIGRLNDMVGSEILSRILSIDPLPDGIFASNDTSAVSAMCELKKAGIRVPEDIAIAGFNNDPISRYVEPDLSTVNYPGKEMGEIAAQTLINKLNNLQSTSLNTIVLSHSLMLRKSSQKEKQIDS